MSDHILFAAALQGWDDDSTDALAARDVAMTLALGASKRLHVLSAYHDDEPPYGIGRMRRTGPVIEQTRC